MPGLRKDFALKEACKTRAKTLICFFPGVAQLTAKISGWVKAPSNPRSRAEALVAGVPRANRHRALGYESPNPEGVFTAADRTNGLSRCFLAGAS